MGCIAHVATELHHRIPIVAEAIVCNGFLQFLRVKEIEVSAKELADYLLWLESLPRVIETDITLINKWIGFLLRRFTFVAKLHIRGDPPG
jgi:hypothetical protein